MWPRKKNIRKRRERPKLIKYTKTKEGRDNTGIMEKILTSTNKD